MHKLSGLVTNPLTIYLISIGGFTILTFSLFTMQARVVLGFEQISPTMYVIPITLGLFIGFLFGKIFILLRTVETAQNRLYQSEKMASIGQLAAGMAHQINNPMGFITSNFHATKNYIGKLHTISDITNNATTVEQIKEAWQENDIGYILNDLLELTDENIEGASRITKIVKDLRTFSNIDRNEEELVNINEVLQSVCNVAANDVMQKAVLTVDFGDIPETVCQPGFLGQAFINILTNAVDAVDEGGNIHISSTMENGEICVRISDSGCGIPKNMMHRIFDPFLTTREMGARTGLGLTVSRDIINSHQGRLEINSQSGSGTTVTIKLPVISSRPAATSNARS